MNQLLSLSITNTRKECGGENEEKNYCIIRK